MSVEAFDGLLLPLILHVRLGMRRIGKFRPPLLCQLHSTKSSVTERPEPLQGYVSYVS